MKIERFICAGLVLLATALPGISDTLSVNENVTPDGSLYDYSYQFSISGTGALVDNIFLGTNDISPLDVVLKVDGTTTADWSWLGNDTPENYLQFFDTAGTGLGNGDVLDVTFQSALAPGSIGFAEGLASSTGAATNVVNSVTVPAFVSPEPANLPLVACCMAMLLIAGRSYQKRFRR